MQNIQGINLNDYQSLSGIYSVSDNAGAMMVNGDVSCLTFMKQPINYFTNITSNIQNQINSISSSGTVILSNNNIFTGTNNFNNTVTFAGSVNGLTKGMVTLGLVNNTSDAGKPVSTAQLAALNLKSNLAGTNTFTGNNIFNNNLPTSILTPSLNTEFITKLYGDSNYTNLSNIQSNNNTFSGTNNFNNTVYFNGSVNGLNKDMVSLSLVDNTSDINKPVSDAQLTALNLKSNLEGTNTFTGNNIFNNTVNFNGSVNGLNKGMVTLGLVNNTSDAGKPVSTAQLAALNLKSNLAGNNTFIGDNIFNGITTINGTTNINGILGATSLYAVNDISFGGTLNLNTNSITLSQTELSYLDGATSNIQTQIITLQNLTDSNTNKLTNISYIGGVTDLGYITVSYINGVDVVALFNSNASLITSLATTNNNLATSNTNITTLATKLTNVSYSNNITTISNITNLGDGSTVIDSTGISSNNLTLNFSTGGATTTLLTNNGRSVFNQLCTFNNSIALLNQQKPGNIAQLSVNTTLTLSQLCEFIFITGGITITIPMPATLNNGFKITFRKFNSTAASTISSATNLYASGSISLVSSIIIPAGITSMSFVAGYNAWWQY